MNPKNFEFVISILILVYIARKCLYHASVFDAVIFHYWHYPPKPTKESRIASRVHSILMILPMITALVFGSGMLYIVLGLCLVITYETMGVYPEDMVFNLLFPLTAIGTLIFYVPMRKSAFRAFMRGRARKEESEAKKLSTMQ
jgi:hypothetical protein